MSGAAQAQGAAPAAPKPLDCSTPEFRQFDFWVGDWDVVPNPATAPTPPPAANGSSGVAAATPPGRNRIERAHKGCVLVENWDDGEGGTGQSFNIYDRTRGEWHQTWVDSGGGLHEYWGRLVGGNMVFEGQVPLGPAARAAGRRTVRLTFFPLGPNTVRQFSEALNTDGTWSVNYDLIYTRRATASPPR